MTKVKTANQGVIKMSTELGWIKQSSPPTEKLPKRLASGSLGKKVPEGGALRQKTLCPSYPLSKFTSVSSHCKASNSDYRKAGL